MTKNGIFYAFLPKNWKFWLKILRFWSKILQFWSKIFKNIRGDPYGVFSILVSDRGGRTQWCLLCCTTQYDTCVFVFVSKFQICLFLYFFDIIVTPNKSSTNLSTQHKTEKFNCVLCLCYTKQTQNTCVQHKTTQFNCVLCFLCFNQNSHILNRFLYLKRDRHQNTIEHKTQFNCVLCTHNTIE